MVAVAGTVAVVAIGAAAWFAWRVLWWRHHHAARCRHLATAREMHRQAKEQLAEVAAERDRARALAAGLEERLAKLDRALDAAKLDADPGMQRTLDEIRGLQ